MLVTLVVDRRKQDGEGIPWNPAGGLALYFADTPDREIVVTWSKAHVKEPSMVALAFSHIGISVADLEEAVDFYSKVLSLYVIIGPNEIGHDDSGIDQMCDDVFGDGWVSLWRRIFREARE